MIKKILLIDVDDTLLDFTKSERVAMGLTLKCFGLDNSDENIELYHKINLATWEEYERGEIERDQIGTLRFKRLLNVLNATAVNCDQVDATYCDNLKNQHFWIDGAKEFLQSILDYYRVILVSNGHEHIQKPRLRDSGLGEMVESVFVSEMVGTRKPEVEFFQAVERNTPDFDKNKCILVGDSLTSDILGGINYGIPTIWYNPKNKPKTSVKPNWTANSFDELKAYLVAFSKGVLR